MPDLNPRQFTSTRMPPPSMTVTAIGEQSPREVMLRGDRSATQYQSPGPVARRAVGAVQDYRAAAGEGPSATARPKPAAPRKSRFADVRLPHWSKMINTKTGNISGQVSAASSRIRTHR